MKEKRPKFEEQQGGDDGKFSKGGPQEQSFESIADAEEFWRTIYKDEGNGNPEAEWLNDVAQAMEGAVPEQEVGEINITWEAITKALEKKENWSALVPGGICNYWLKKLANLHKPMADASQELLTNNTDPERGRMEQSQPLLHHVYGHCI